MKLYIAGIEIVEKRAMEKASGKPSSLVNRIRNTIDRNR
jgi:hypothetical protein